MEGIFISEYPKIPEFLKDLLLFSESIVYHLCFPLIIISAVELIEGLYNDETISDNERGVLE